MAKTLDTEQMAQAGLYFGHKTSKIHPKMKPYIFGARNGVHIFDLDKTKEKLQEVLDLIVKMISDNKMILLVGTKIQIKDLVKKTAEECGLPYVSERWLGGTFTNFHNILKRIEYYKDIENKKATGELEKYTKKERANFDKELQDLEKKFSGIKNLQQLPDVIFVCDMKKDKLAVREAKAKGITVIGISDTNIDPSQADYFIPANDDAASSVRYILEKVKEAVLGTKPKKQNK
ncbi:MAG: 30S ribosomal protein S2 [Candidatus Nealsonbacteria bacterium]|nr:30S ribosomal protein S2 [Candidatus Nealsonbacteria bacterium]